VFSATSELIWSARLAAVGRMAAVWPGDRRQDQIPEVHDHFESEWGRYRECRDFHLHRVTERAVGIRNVYEFIALLRSGLSAVAVGP
jgi:hypothetical protein